MRIAVYIPKGKTHYIVKSDRFSVTVACGRPASRSSDNLEDVTCARCLNKEKKN